MPKYIAIFAKVPVQKNYPRLFEFLRKGQVETYATHLTPYVIGFRHSQDIEDIRDTFLSLLDSEDEFALLEVQDCIHRMSGGDGRRLQNFLDLPEDDLIVRPQE
jgi:hypothetical protein